MNVITNTSQQYVFLRSAPFISLLCLTILRKCHFLVAIFSQVHNGNNESSSQDTDQLFDVHPLTGVNLDTFAKQGGLNLMQGESYQVVVIATNEAGGCVDASAIVKVDTTAPQDGQIYVGPDSQSVSINVEALPTLLLC